MQLTADLALVLVRTALRTGQLDAAKALLRAFPVLRSTAAVRKHTKTLSMRGRSAYPYAGVRYGLRTHSGMLNQPLNITATRNRRGFTLSVETTGTVTVKSRFKAHGWWWNATYDSDTLRVYRRGNLYAAAEQRECDCRCEPHSGDEVCVVCAEATPPATVAALRELPEVTATNTRSVRQWMRCHRARLNYDVMHLYCVKYAAIRATADPDRNVARWRDVCAASGPTYNPAGRLKLPAVLPCYRDVVTEASIVAPPFIAPPP